MKTKLWSKAFLLVGCSILLGCGCLFGCARKTQPAKTLTPKEIFAAQENVLTLGRGADRRFYALRETAKLAVEAGDFGKARQYATELLQKAPKYKKNWNYGNAIHDGHMVHGRVVLNQGNQKAAVKQLLEAGKTPGSPQLDSFGPNMSLAKDLIAKGEKKSVITYFDECKFFWKDDNGHLDTWKNEVEEGKTPDFGPNLHY